ncbi:type II secretion system GspH family protein [Shewanella rhizosphaerae]|uniref:type II secretion system protein n=1 Tax=Shewanella rhizosphaerae TaxID=2864207 RepID=UPI001C6596B8|nr:type II secretion system protein [Shewanella rhizosphaerae]QYK13017.1 type II secretion system GspH family protein [Shewanella rhizosphaerae]
MRHKGASGFTLIEMVVVIIILAILSVAAASRWISLTREARIAQLKQLEASVQAANQLVYARSAILGLEKQPKASFFLNPGDSQKIQVRYGNPVWGGDAVTQLLTVTMSEWFYGGRWTVEDIELRIGDRSLYKTPGDLMADGALACYLRVDTTADSVTTKIMDSDC